MSPEIDLLTTLSTQPFSACQSQWEQLLRRIFLPMSFVPAIQAVLEKGRWRRQPNPMAYVRKGSLRSAVRLGIVDVRRNSRREVLATDLNFAGFHFKDSEGKSLNHDDRLGTALSRRDEQFRTGLGADHGSIYDEDDIINRLPGSLLDKNLEVKWDRVAEMAKMDSGERIVLKLRLSGLERNVALAACYTDDDRKILQAAWKRFDRHKELFKHVLMSGKPVSSVRTQAGQNPPAVARKPISAPVRRIREVEGPADRANETHPPNDTSCATPQLEMILIELPQGGMKISFRKSVAKKSGVAEKLAEK